LATLFATAEKAVSVLQTKSAPSLTFFIVPSINPAVFSMAILQDIGSRVSARPENKYGS
jgi:hypothetical protein